MRSVAPLLILLAVLGGVGAAGYLLLLEEPEAPTTQAPTHGGAERTTPGNAPKSPGPRPAVRSQEPMARARHGDRNLEDWFLALRGAAVTAKNPAKDHDVEAHRYAIRQWLTATESLPEDYARFTGHRSPLIRREAMVLAVDALGIPGDALLRAWLEKETPSVLGPVLARLRRHGQAAEATVDRLFPKHAKDLLTATSDASLAMAAASTLTRRPEPDTEEILRALHGKHLPPLVRSAATEALVRTLPEELGMPPEDPERFLERTRHKDPIVRTAMLRESGKFLRRHMKGLAPEQIASFRNGVRSALESDPNPSVRVAAVRSRVGLLASNKPLEQCRALIDAGLGDPDPSVRLAILERLWEVTKVAPITKSLSPKFLEWIVLDDDNPAVRWSALRLLTSWAKTASSKEVHSWMVRSVRHDPNSTVRLHGAALLTHLGYLAARPILNEVVSQDRDPAVRAKLFNLVAEQLAYADPDLVRSLAARDASWRAKGEGLPDPSPDGPGDALRLRLPAPKASEFTRPAAIANLSREVAPDDSHRVTLKTEDGLHLEGAFIAPQNEPRGIVVVLSADPLLGGVRPTLKPEALQIACARRDLAILTFRWRGRGSSEGHGANLPLDARAAMAFAVRSSNGQIPILVLADGSGATVGGDVFQGIAEIPSDRRLNVAGRESLAPDPRTAFQRASAAVRQDQDWESWLNQANRRR